MNKFFRIDFPDRDPIAIVGKNGYSDLLGLFDGVEDKNSTYIISISWYEFIKFIMRW